MGNSKAKANYRRTVLRSPDLDHSKSALLNGFRSPGSVRVYQYAIEQFTARYCSEPALVCNPRVPIPQLPKFSKSAVNHCSCSD
jgi:hypothetical protein